MSRQGGEQWSCSFLSGIPSQRARCVQAHCHGATTRVLAAQVRSANGLRGIFKFSEILGSTTYNGSAGMTLYYYVYRSWQDCCRRGENRSWRSVSDEPVDSECWYLNNAFVYAFIMRLTVEERVLRSTFKLNTLYNEMKA